MRHKNVFLYGYYGFDNFGDELLLRAISERIFRSNQNIKFFVRSLNEVTVVSEKIQSTCVDTILLKKKNWLLKAGIYIKELLYWCRKSDELWIGGGGLFLDKGRVNIHLIFLFLICLYINKVKRCPIHILGVSFDYLTSPISIWITKNILTLATSVSIRDPLSCAYANQISGLTTTLSEDLIFVSDYIKNELPPTKENGYVGLSFVDYFGAYKFKNALSEKFDQSLKKYILSFPLETKFKYFVFQSTIGLNDKKYLDFILSLNRTVELVYCNKWEEFIIHLASCRAVTTMRFHLSLIALRYGIPTLVIDHELKLSALGLVHDAQLISLQEFCEYGLDSKSQILTKKEFNLARAHLLAEKNFSFMEKLK